MGTHKNTLASAYTEEGGGAVVSFSSVYCDSNSHWGETALRVLYYSCRTRSKLQHCIQLCPRLVRLYYMSSLMAVYSCVVHVRISFGVRLCSLVWHTFYYYYYFYKLIMIIRIVRTCCDWRTESAKLMGTFLVVKITKCNREDCPDGKWSAVAEGLLAWHISRMCLARHGSRLWANCALDRAVKSVRRARVKDPRASANGKNRR